MRILGNEPKRLGTIAKRGLDFADLTPEFFASAIVRDVRLGPQQAIGRLAGWLVAAVFLPMGSEAIAVISLRRASRKERMIYGAEDPPADR